MEDYFIRQIAWFENLIDEMENLEQKWTEGDLGELIARRTATEAKTRSLGGEFHSLLKEWNSASDISEEDRKRIGELAARADSLAGQLRERLENAARDATRQGDALLKSFEEVRQGRDMLSKYKPGGSEGPSRVDRRA